MADSAPIETAAGPAPSRQGIPRIALIIGGVAIVGIFLLGQRKSSATNAPLAEPNTNVFLGSIEQQLQELKGITGLGNASLGEQITNSTNSITGQATTFARTNSLWELIAQINQNAQMHNTTPEWILANDPNVLASYNELRNQLGLGSYVPMNPAPESNGVTDSLLANSGKISGA